MTPDMIQQMHDRLMITDMTSRYAYLLDYRRDLTRELAELFVEDATFELPLQGILYRGRDALFEAFAKVHGLKRDLHHFTSNLVIDLHGDRATGHLHFNEFLLLPDRVHSYSQGHYEDDYTRTGDGWRFRSRKVFIPADSFALMTAPELVAAGQSVVQNFQSSR
jgi:hypothetical protein